MIIKDKICKQCGNKFKPFNSLAQVCSPKCALEFNSKKEVDKRVKQMKKDVQSLNDLRHIARVAFQAWIRLRDKNQPCISCPATEAKWDGTHYLKAEIYTGLIFDEDNCHKGCANCNLHLQGNIVEYRKGLIKRIGTERVEALEARADMARIYKFSREELILKAQEYKSKIKQLQSQSNVGDNVYEVKIKS